jgi:hypothetical protein
MRSQSEKIGRRSQALFAFLMPTLLLKALCSSLITSIYKRRQSVNNEKKREILEKLLEVGKQLGVPIPDDLREEVENLTEEPKYRVKMSGDLIAEWRRLPELVHRFESAEKELKAVRGLMFAHAENEVCNAIGAEAFHKHNALKINNETWEMEVH